MSSFHFSRVIIKTDDAWRLIAEHLAGDFTSFTLSDQIYYILPRKANILDSLREMSFTVHGLK